MKRLVAISALLTCFLMAGCSDQPDWDSNGAQIAFASKWSDPKSTDAQIDAMSKGGYLTASEWHGIVSNVSEVEAFTVIEAQYRSQTYYLAVFTPEGREKARQLSRDTLLTFSGTLGPELSVTRSGARDNPEYGLYPTKVLGGGVTIAQDPSQISEILAGQQAAADSEAQQTEVERARDQIQQRTIYLCQEEVVRRLKYPVGSSFSWFQADTREEAGSKWTYTDTVTALTKTGEKETVRFICHVSFASEPARVELEYLR